MLRVELKVDEKNLTDKLSLKKLRLPVSCRFRFNRFARRLFHIFLISFLYIAFDLLVSAQTRLPPPPPKQEPAIQPLRELDEDDEITITTSEVLLPVTVRDAQGRIVGNLTQKDFRVYEDEREQPLSSLRLRQVPVDVVMMIDASSSVASSLDAFALAIEEFAARLAPEDRVSLVKFDDRVQLLQDWTQSRIQLRRAVRRITTGMFTRFNDALYLAAREQFTRGGGEARRRAVVVLSDGIDSGRGLTTFDQTLLALLAAQVGVYVISNTEIERTRKQAELNRLLSDDASAIRFNELRIEDLRAGLRALDASERNLTRLTEATGGRLYRPSNFDALDAVYQEIAEELRQQYALYYKPLNTKRDGGFRRARVALSDSSWHVTSRIGYFAPAK